ncbi:hypothetical protein RRF57_013360 [Xylaria bambusicola]|uniref:DUF6546 domain-containing protein n=1 Tax=Xylaria bambusicola TaxID=326684 RepID=A0AAN7URM6_9PEZI
MSSLTYIPPEIIQQIAYYLTHDWVNRRTRVVWRLVPGAANYAIVNKVWQDAIEREIFSVLDLRLNPLAEADVILNGNPRRQKYVRRISLKVTPAVFLYYSTLCGEWLSAMANLPPKPENESCRAPGSAITLHLEGGDPDYFSPRCNPNEFEARENIRGLAPMNVITELEICWGEWTLSPRAVCLLLAKLLALRRAKIRFQDRELAQGLLNVMHSLDELTIGSCGYQHLYPDDAHAWEADRLSYTLGLISQRVRILCLCGLYVTTGLFLQPMSSPATADRVQLEDFRIYLNSGYYLQWTHGNQDLMDRNTQIKRPYLAAGRAALGMPLLKTMSLTNNMAPKRAFDNLKYHRDTRANTAKVCWGSDSGFVPDAEVIIAWQEVARKQTSG